MHFSASLSFILPRPLFHPETELHLVFSLLSTSAPRTNSLQDIPSPRHQILPFPIQHLPTPTPSSLHPMKRSRSHITIRDSCKLHRQHRPSSPSSRSQPSSISSLGSFPDADLVAQQFSPSLLSRQRAMAVDSPVFPSDYSTDHLSTLSSTTMNGTDSSSPRICPHCKKKYSAAWAVPKHVQVRYTQSFSQLRHFQKRQECHPHIFVFLYVLYLNVNVCWCVPMRKRIHDRNGLFHCPKCTYKTPHQDMLQQHEKDKHRKCPFCGQVFLLLNKHIGSCPKR